MENQFLSEKVQNLKESATLAMANKARELREAGEDIINMSLGEPDFDTPDYIKDAAIKAIENNYSHYSPVKGFLEARKAICHKYRTENDFEISPDQVLISNGAKQSIANLVLAVLNPGDEVVLPAPFWVSYKDIIEFFGGKVKIVPTDINSQFRITPQQLKDSLTQKTKMFLFSNPCNPSGAIYTKSELDEFAEIFKKYPDLLIVSDEIYEYINFSKDWVSFAHYRDLISQLVIVNGLSKGFAATGWRIGSMIGPIHVINACQKIQGQTTSGANTIAQMACVEAFNQGKESVEYMREAFQKRRDLLFQLLSEVEGVKVILPLGAFYMFPDISAFIGKSYSGGTINNSKDLCFYLLEYAKVAMTPGEAFGCPNNIRLSYALSENDIQEAVKRIKSALMELN
jgi:aspartate aminotransferase